MSSTPLLPTPAAGSDAPPPETCAGSCKKALRVCAITLAIIALVVFVLVWIVQGIVFWWATSMFGCSAGSLTNYSYPGGGSNSNGGAELNLLPAISLLAERQPMWYGDAFDVIPSNEASTIADAPVGTWWRTWGPIFYTYTYEDVANSRTTLYMRRNLLRLGMSHRIVRCDGQGPRITFTEGANFLVNRIRRAFGMNQGYSFKVYLDDELVAVAEETSNGFPSMTFREDPSGDTIASSVLQDRHFHGKYDLWLVKNQEETPLPYFVASAATVLFAVAELHAAPSSNADVPPAPPASPPPKMFLSPPNRTSDFAAASFTYQAAPGLQLPAHDELSGDSGESAAVLLREQQGERQQEEQHEEQQRHQQRLVSAERVAAAEGIADDAPEVLAGAPAAPLHAGTANAANAAATAADTANTAELREHV